jgi:aspartyl-tRNA(Asn)/glutamyl-tRNA(Gln) amidotransferase subunit B
MSLIESAINDADKATFFASWQVNIEIPLRKPNDKATTFDLKTKQHIFNSVYSLMKENKLNSSRAKELLTLLLNSELIPDNIESLAIDKGFIQVSDEAELTNVIVEIIAANEQAANDVKNGETQAIGFLVGKVMQATKGRANPELTQKIIRDKLGV